MDFSNAVSEVLDSYYLQAILALVAADFVTGVFSAVRRGVFSWRKLGDVIPKNVLTSLAALGAQVVAALATSGGLETVINASAFSVLAASMGHSIAENVQEATGLMLMPYIDKWTNLLLGWLKSGQRPTPSAVPPPTAASSKMDGFIEGLKQGKP